MEYEPVVKKFVPTNKKVYSKNFLLLPKRQPSRGICDGPILYRGQ